MKKTKKVDGLVDQIKKTAKKKIVKKNLLVVPTGITLLDLTLGEGIGTGFTNIVGDSQSGKSVLTGEILAGMRQYFNGKMGWYYDDVETGYKVKSKERYGFDIINEGKYKKEERSNTIQDMEYKTNDIIETKPPKLPFVFVNDSYDALTEDAEIKFENERRKARNKVKKEGDKEKGTYGAHKPKFLHKFCRSYIRKLDKNKIFFIIISQVKDNFDFGFGPKHKRLGGRALDFYPSSVFWLSVKEKYKLKKLDVGVCIKINSTKSRNDKPYRFCYIDIIYDYGVDNITTNIKYLYDLKTEGGKDIEKTKTMSLKWDKKEYTVNLLRKHIEKNDLEQELADRVIKKWNDIEESISSKGRKSKWIK